MSSPPPVSEFAAPSLAFGFEHAPVAQLLGQADVLAVLGFGATPGLPDDPRVLRVGLAPLQAAAPFEVWRSSGTVACGRDGDLRWSGDGEHLFVAFEVDEAAHGGIAGAAEYAYERLGRFLAGCPTPHLWRLWNYLDAINLGDGDDERYRRFCQGRARGMRTLDGAPYPAATAIGRQDGVRVLQVYGLAARRPGTPVENPRQVSAWRYPRQYGPTAPTFARGMRADARLLISGTAAVVGHASAHHDDLAAQVDETLANLASLLDTAGTTMPLGAPSQLKAYLRDPADAAFVAAALAARLPQLGGLLLLAGDICRRELLIEIDGVHRLR
jgi:chorismate lyase/3-hydroxybenzoate synthase